MKILFSVIFVLQLLVCFVLTQDNRFLQQNDNGVCVDQESTLLEQQQKICSSLTQSNTSWCGNSWQDISVGESWPSQVVYFQQLLNTLEDPSTCLNTLSAKNTIFWLVNTQLLNQNPGNFAWTWDIFQVQYFDMPRKPGNRIESPNTLGEKCWAFAFLSQNWNPQLLQNRLQQNGLSLEPLISQYSEFIPKTMNLCNEVIANCFVNATYNPQARNGTCWFDVLKFKAGFYWENIRQGHIVKFPFYT